MDFIILNKYLWFKKIKSKRVYIYIVDFFWCLKERIGGKESSYLR